MWLLYLFFVTAVRLDERRTGKLVDKIVK